METRQQCARCGNARFFRITKDEADKVYVYCFDCGANLSGAEPDDYEYMETIPPNKYEGSE